MARATEKCRSCGAPLIWALTQRERWAQTPNHQFNPEAGLSGQRHPKSSGLANRTSTNIRFNDSLPARHPHQDVERGSRTDRKVQMYNLAGEYPDWPSRLLAWPDFCIEVARADTAEAEVERLREALRANLADAEETGMGANKACRLIADRSRAALASSEQPKGGGEW